jgi:penicillin-binding protein activator
MYMKIKKLPNAVIMFSMLSLVGCASSSGPGVQYGDVKEKETLTNEISTNDIEQLAETLASKLLRSPFIASVSGKPLIQIEPVKNMTSEMFSPKQITDRVKNKLRESGKFSFNRDDADAAAEQKKLQKLTQGGIKPSNDNKKIGAFKTAKYSMYGEVSSIVKRASDVKNIDYTLTLTIQDMETGEEVWSGNEDIRKTSARSTF